MVITDIAQTAGNHDGLVVTPDVSRHRLLKGPEVTGKIGSTKFVVEGCATNGTLNHDIKRGRDAVRPAVVRLPGLRSVGQLQVGNAETCQPRLGFGTEARRAFIADFAPGAGRRPRKRCDGSRMIVGFNLDQHMDRFRMFAIFPGHRIRVETRSLATLDNRGIVFIGAEHTGPVRRLVGIPDHCHQRMGLTLAVDQPVGLEGLVPAVLGIRLGEHHQFNVCRIATEFRKGIAQIVDLIIRQRHAQIPVRSIKCSSTLLQQGHRIQSPRSLLVE